MGFDLSVSIVATTFEAILLLIGAGLYFSGSQALGFLMMIVAIGLFVLPIFFGSKNQGSTL